MMSQRLDFEAVVIEDVVQCDDMIQKFLTGIKFVGFDCEWISKNKISLIQISTDHKVLLFRLNRMSVITERLEQFLGDSSVFKFGVSIARDGDKMWTDHKVRLAGKVELRQLMRSSKPYLEVFWKQIEEFEGEISKKKQFNPRFDMAEERKRWKPRAGLKALARDLLNVEMDKKVELRAGNWNTSILSPEQTHYAALDAWVALKIAQCLASPSLNMALSEKIETNLIRISKIVVERPYSDKADHVELLKMISKEHPEFKIKEYVPGKPSAPLTKALQRRLEKEKVMQCDSSDDEEGEMHAIRQDDIPSHHQQTCY